MFCMTDVTLLKSIETIEAADAVLGLAVHHNKLFVLRKRDDKQLHVYDTDDYRLQYTVTIPGLQPVTYNDDYDFKDYRLQYTVTIPDLQPVTYNDYDFTDYRLQYTVTIPGMQKERYNDLTECATENCLFVSDFAAKCVYKVKPNAEQRVSKFIDVPYQPKGLSITPEGNLLVACNPNKLVEYNVTTGEKVCELELHLEVKCPLHAVKRSDGQYVVCHTDERLSRVCRVGKDGYYRHCYGGLTGKGDDQLNYACHVAVCENDDVIVADSRNNRLVLLDKSMEFVESLAEDFREPHRVWFDRESRRLYVGECAGSSCVKVFNVIQ